MNRIPCHPLSSPQRASASPAAPDAAASRRRVGTVKRGGILVEAAMAAVVAGMAVAAIAQLLMVLTVQERTLELRRLALQEAANALERLAAWPAAQVTPERAVELKLSADAQRRLPAGTLQVRLTPRTEPQPTVEVVSTVSWQSPAGTNEQVQLTSWRTLEEDLP